MFGSRDNSQSYAARTFGIPDETCARVGVSAAWRSGESLVAFAARRIGRPAAADGERVALHAVRRCSALSSPVARKLAAEACGAFLAAQREGARFAPLSRAYRAIAREGLEGAREALERGDETEAERAASLYATESIWHLAEILLAESADAAAPLAALLDWVRFQCPRHERRAERLLRAGAGADDDPLYWETAFGLLLQGRVEAARALLRLHSDSRSDPFLLVDDALRTMPLYDARGGVPAAEFDVGRKHWRLDCLAKINADSFRSEPDLEIAMRLLIGERSAFERLRDKCESWYDAFGAWILYAEPAARRRDLGRLARSCASVVTPASGQIKHLDFVILSLMELELHQVIHDIQNFPDNGWFVAHFADLLYRCGKLDIADDQQSGLADKVRDGFVAEYGSSLMEHESLWQTGLVYLAHGGREGRARADLLLQRLALSSERRTLKIVRAANALGLADAGDSACAAASARSLARWRDGKDDDAALGSSLAWALRGRCGARAARVADCALRAYVRDGRLRCADAPLSLGADAAPPERLLFLGKYAEFHKAYRAGRFEEAAQLSVSLMTSGIAPDYFRLTLLMDALPLLESDVPLMSCEETFRILRTLEEHLPENESELHEAELLRYAIIRNLARTIVDEEPSEDLPKPLVK